MVEMAEAERWGRKQESRERNWNIVATHLLKSLLQYFVYYFRGHFSVYSFCSYFNVYAALCMLSLQIDLTLIDFNKN